MSKSFREKVKDAIYVTASAILMAYWKVFRPRTAGARLLLVHDGRILLVQPRRSDYWNFPGGGIHSFEDPALTAIRELHEETGIIIPNIDYRLGTYTSENEGKKDIVHIFVATATDERIPKLEIELQNAKWFLLDSLPPNATKTTRYRIEEYQKGMRDLSGPWTKLP